MLLSEWREFPSAPCVPKKKIMKTRVSKLLKWRASLTCFRAYFLRGRAKDLSAPRNKRLDRLLGLQEFEVPKIFRHLYMKVQRCQP